MNKKIGVDKLLGLDAEAVHRIMKAHSIEMHEQLDRWKDFGQHIINTAFHGHEFDIGEWAVVATDLIEETEEIID